MAASSVKWSDEELRENVGQLFIVGFHGHVPSVDIKTLVTTHKVGSVIFFQRNIKDTSQLLALTSDLQQIAKESGHTQPLLIGIDQENGLITRIKEPFSAQLPGSMALAATGDVLNAYRVASATAETLRGYGINLNYAPIADVNSEAKNPVIGVRSPSDDPGTVGRVVSAQLKGLKEGGVIPCVKHFPGHGDTAVDSHFGLPIIPKSKQELDGCELVPFRRAVMEGVDAIMTAHISLPNLGYQELPPNLKDLPASLNLETIAILREEMKFEGLIVSDCLEMDGIRANYGTEESAVMALKAGTDCVMVCHTIAAQLGAIKRVIEAVRSGDLSQDDVAKSVSRVRALKSKYLSTPAMPATPTALQDALIRHRSLAAEIYAKSTTLVRHESTSFPLSPALPKIVLITPAKSRDGGGAVDSGDSDTEDFVSGSFYTSLIESISPILEVIEIQFQPDAPLSKEFEKVIEQAPAVILTTRNATLSQSQRSLGLALGQKLGHKLIAIATCDPYDFLHDTAEVKNYIVTYEPTLPAFKVAIDIIFGVAPALGHLPVTITPTNHNEHINLVSHTDKSSLLHLWALWNKIFAPRWAMESHHLTNLLTQSHCVVLLHPKAFSISYLCEGGVGKLTAVGVLSDFRSQGLGTALVDRARREISKLGEVKSWGVGSSFPRFWAGVPFDVDREFGEFFLHRGFRKSTSPTARDLFRDITADIATAPILAKVAALNIKFKPWTKEIETETLIKQEGNFGDNKAWVQAYHHLANSNQHHEVMVAVDPLTDKQIGWTIMSSSSSIVSKSFAFLPLCPSGQDTGLIACVGVDKEARGRGVGLGLLVKAMENMRERGLRGVLIDWVVIRGFYETLGFEPIWEYEGYDW